MKMQGAGLTVLDREPETKKAEGGIKLSDEHMDRIMGAILIRFNEEKLYLRKDLTLDRLSKMIGINKSYVSQTINVRQEKNYSNFINEFRVREAQTMLALEKYDYLSIEGIAKSVGFKSRSNFHIMFKKYTGFTPNDYMHTIRKKIIPMT